MPQPIDVVEALLFASDTPVEVGRIQEVLDLGSAAEARALVEDLKARYEAEERGLQIVEVGGGFRMGTRPEGALPQPATTLEGQPPAVTVSGETAQQDPGRSGAGLTPGE